MKIPTASHNCFVHPPQQEEQPHDVNSSDDEEEEEDFSTSLSYCSSSYLVEQMNNSNKLRKADSFSGSCYGIAQEQQQYPINGDEESSNQCKVIWCDVCQQEGFEEVATHYCSTCFNEKSREVILLDGNEEETLEESNSETIVCHYCQYHANRHNRRDSLHQIVSIRQERMFPSSSSSLLRSGSFMSSGSSYDSNMSNSSPIPFFTPPLGSTSTGPLFTYSFNNNNNILAGSNINNMVRYCFKHEEAIPINTYCRTCELVICSQCALSKEHKGHLIELIKDVEATERMQLSEHIKVLKQSFEEWEEEFNVYNHDLEEELKLIDDREETLTSHINAAFDELKESLERRRSSLIEKVEQSCHENKQSVHNILKMKKESKELLGEFDNLEEMSGFDIIDKKLNRLNLIIVLYEKMQREFKTRKLSDLHLVSLNKFTSRKKVIQRQIDELGQVVEKTTSRDDSSVPSSTSIPINFKYVETIGAGGNTSNSKQVQFSFPSDVKISHQHSCIIVTDFGNKKIRVLDLTTRRLKYDINTIAAPRNVSIDHTDDDSIIVSCADHCIYKYSLLDKGKNIIWRSGSPNESGNSEHLFKYPRASIVDADGNIYVCDHGLHRIKVLRSSDGKVVKIIGTDQQDQIQFKRPWGIDINKEGNIVISEKKNNRIQRISKEGDISLFLLGKKGSSQYEFNKPRGVLIDPHNDNTFICDGENHRIQVFSKAGKLIKSFGSEGSKSSQLCQPHSLCFDYLSGQLFVADCANSRIQIFQ